MKSYYLGAAIDLSTENPFDVMNKKVTELDPQCVIFRPDKAYNNAYNASVEPAKYLKEVNDFALLAADVAIFYISSKIFSMGAALEIQERAKMHQKESKDCFLDNFGSITPINPKKTVVITDKAGLYLKVQQSEHLLLHISDTPLEDIDFLPILEKVGVKWRN